MDTSRTVQRVGGFLIAATGIGFTIWTWHDATTTGFFSVRAALLFPAFSVVGLALLLVPGYKEERRARGEDTSRMKGWRLITKRWWFILAIALGAGFFNLWYLQR